MKNVNVKGGKKKFLKLRGPKSCVDVICLRAEKEENAFGAVTQVSACRPYKSLEKAQIINNYFHFALHLSLYSAP